MFQNYFYPLSPSIICGIANTPGVADAPQLGTHAKLNTPMAMLYLPSAFKIILADKGGLMVKDCFSIMPDDLTSNDNLQELLLGREVQGGGEHLVPTHLSVDLLARIIVIDIIIIDMSSS
jgi:hypothetical protein